MGGTISTHLPRTNPRCGDVWTVTHGVVQENSTDTIAPWLGLNADLLWIFQLNEQESCAIAKMTAQCALHMGALKIFGTP